MRLQISALAFASAALVAQSAAAQTEINFWHAFTGRLGDLVAEQVEIQARYAGYLERQQAEIDKAGHTVLRNPARHDTSEMREVRLDVDRQAVKTDPLSQADADCGNLVFARRSVRVRRGRPA